MMIKKYLMYFGAMLGILAVCVGSLIGTAFLYNYVVTTFSATAASLMTLGISITVVAAALAVVLVLMNEDL